MQVILLAKVKQSARATAARVIALVVGKQRSLNGVLTEHLALLPENERSLCQQLCYGVVRFHPQLNMISQQLLKKALKAKDGDIAALLLIGLYQLRELRIPPHAAISETVNATKILGKQWSKGLINASLRNYQRQEEDINITLSENDVATYAHPEWLIERYQTDWMDHWQKIMEANNQQPPMMLRVNQQQGTRQDYLLKLEQADIGASEIVGCGEGILLDSPCDVYQLPGFTEGAVSVQDGAAQYVAQILDIKDNVRILDACAAPGGKTCHILECEPSNEVVALDISETRLEQITQNTDRLQLNVELIAADAGNVDKWWDGQLFDRILIDAPCSGTGVIRRHPDIKLLRRPEDIDSLAAQQKALLDALWPLLNSGGLLVYTTCSALKQENEQQVEQFLASHPDAIEQKRTPEPATRQNVGYQRLPGDDGLDGFYYACLTHR